MTTLLTVSHSFKLLQARWEQLSNLAEQQAPNNMQKHRASRIPSTDQTSEDLKKLRRLSSITSITSFGSPHSFTSWIPFTRKRATTDIVNNASKSVIREDNPDDGPLLTENSGAKGSCRTPMTPISGNGNSTGRHGRQLVRPSLPRSSTLSHLPISIASRQPSETRPLLAPSQNSSALQPSRIPTPIINERSRMQDRSKISPITPKRNAFARPPRTSSIQRASTQPVLPTIEATPPSVGKTKKENTLKIPGNANHSVIHQPGAAKSNSFKPISDTDMWKKIDETEYDAEDESRIFRKTAPNPTPRRATNLQMTDEHAGIYYMSPMAQSMQQSKSQPNVSSAGISKHQHTRSTHQIAQHQLLQPLRPPIPPIPQTPLLQNRAANKKIHDLRKSSSPHYESSPSSSSPHDGWESPETARQQLLQVSIAQPATYWAGRLLALTDRLQSEHASQNLLSRRHHHHRRPGTSPFSHLSGHSSPKSKSTTTTTSSSSSLHLCINPLDIELESDTDRTRAALTLLFAYCTTQAAVDSLREFQLAHARRVRVPELAQAIPTSRIEKVALEVGTVREVDVEEEEEEGGQGMVEPGRNRAGAVAVAAAAAAAATTVGSGSGSGRRKRRRGFWAWQRQREESLMVVDEELGKSAAGAPGNGGGGATGRKFSFVEKWIGKTRRKVS